MDQPPALPWITALTLFSVTDLLCRCLQAPDLMDSSETDPQEGPLPTVEVFRLLGTFRATASLAQQAVDVFLLQEEGKSFAALVSMYRVATERLRYGVEDILSHYNDQLYASSAIIPHIDRIQMEQGLGFRDVVLRYFRFLTLVPSSLISTLALEILERDHINPDWSLSMRFPQFSQMVWPLYGDTGYTMPPRPLRTSCWASARHIIIVGLYSRRHRDIVLPGHRRRDATGSYVSRFLRLDGSLAD